ncbi:hypothetical protein FACS1894211_08760 [Clostridia bacterium]|nr:hypothetical protein FACS1894211_08760 [Clostridia bacterium]
MKKIYFAGPLFCQAEKDYNLVLAQFLEKEGYEVFLPQRDGYEAALLSDKTETEKIKLIFEKDTAEIRKADVVFMVLDGRVPDDGACVELGYAFALGKKCYGIKTDVRSLEINMDLNPLLVGCFDKVFNNSNFEIAQKELAAYIHTVGL